jgi:hypothetical protein
VIQWNKPFLPNPNRLVITNRKSLNNPNNPKGYPNNPKGSPWIMGRFNNLNLNNIQVCNPSLRNNKMCSIFSRVTQL